VMKRIDSLPAICAEPIGWLDRPGLFITRPNQVNALFLELPLLRAQRPTFMHHP